MRIAEQETDTVTTTPAAGVVVRSAWQRRILTFLMVFGPGLIVMEADNDINWTIIVFLFPCRCCWQPRESFPISS